MCRENTEAGRVRSVLQGGSSKGPLGRNLMKFQGLKERKEDMRKGNAKMVPLDAQTHAKRLEMVQTVDTAFPLAQQDGNARTQKDLLSHQIFQFNFQTRLYPFILTFRGSSAWGSLR